MLLHCRVSMHVCWFIYVFSWLIAVIGFSSFCVILERLNWDASLYGNQTQCCKTPPSPPFPFSPCLQKIHSVKYRQSVALWATSLHHMPKVRARRCGDQIRESSPCPRPAVCFPTALVMSLRDTYTWLLVSAVAMRTITRCAIYGNPWGRQEGGREWERFTETLQSVSCSKTSRRGCRTAI